MRITTPLAELEMTIGSLKIEAGKLVLRNVTTDTMPTRAVLEPHDLRRILLALLRPDVVWFALTCIWPGKAGGNTATALQDKHPTPNPW